MRLKQSKLDSSSFDKVLEKLPEEKKKAFQKRLSEQFIRRSDSISSSSPSASGRRGKKLGETNIRMYRQTSFAEDPETRPKTMDHAIRWFKENEKPKGIGMDLDGTISLWFHGKCRQL